LIIKNAIQKVVKTGFVRLYWNVLGSYGSRRNLMTYLLSSLGFVKIVGDV